MRTLAIFLLVLVAANSTVGAEKFKWNRFEVNGRPAFTILPPAEKRKEPMPWVMYAPTFNKSLPNESHEGWMIELFLDAGIAIAGVDVGESYGSPEGRATFNALHKHLTEGTPKFSKKASLLARSRGGLMLYNWAVENPEKVECIAGIYPVCDLRSYPGLGRACGAYKLSKEELEKALAKHNPVDRLASLAKAKVPIFHIHGNVDKVVPLDANSGTIQTRYKELGGSMELMIAPNQGHNMWQGFFHCKELVDFVIQHATGQQPSGEEEGKKGEDGAKASSGAALPSPIAHWKLDETTGAVARDSAGEHHGKFVGTIPAQGKHSGGRLFDRPKGDHVAIEYDKSFALSTFTVAAWVKLTRPPTFSGILGTRFGGETTFDMKVNDVKVHGDIGDGSNWIETKVNFYADDTGSNQQGGKLKLDRWYHIAYVIDADRQKCFLYLDADLKKTISFAGKPLLMKPGQQMRIGNSSSDEFMDGIIDDVCIWPTALAGSQVKLLHSK
jgi:hypothetical protein